MRRQSALVRHAGRLHTKPTQSFIKLELYDYVVLPLPGMLETSMSAPSTRMKKTRSTTLKATWMATALIAAAAACQSSPEFTDSDGSTDEGNDLGGGGNDLNNDSDSGTGGNSLDLSNDGNAGSDGNGTGGFGGGSCAESEGEADLVPANLLFVVDKSGSMNCNPPPIDNTCSVPEKVDPGELSKWEITQDALTGPNGALQTLAGQAGISVGMSLFPLDDNCQVVESGDTTVPIALLDQDQMTALQNAIDVEADGQTPLAGAAIRGLEALRLGIHAGDLPGDNYLVVMTDGAETCQPDALDDLLAYVEQALEYYDIKTYAIGAPGSEGSRTLLSQIAILGGTRKSDDCAETPTQASESCHIDLTESTDFEADLGSEFQGITEATTQTCEYDIPQNALIDPSKVNVEYTPTGGQTELIAQDPPATGDEQCEGAEGWQYTADGTQIVLCGQICQDVLADPGAEVRVVFGCKETVVR